MNEHEFIKTLEKRAKEQEKIIKGMILPKMFTPISLWLGNHPWRILIPIAFMFTILLHSLFGKTYDEFILKIFGKL
jgi:hypothetical protein